MPVTGLRTRDNFEAMFVDEEMPVWGDRWRHGVLGSQRVRLDMSLAVLAAAYAPDRRVRVLDVGCGQGDFGARLERRYRKMDYTGVDIALNALAWARRRLPRKKYVEAALPCLPFAGSSFDVVCALEVLYYLEAEDVGLALSDIARVMRPGGVVLISGPLDGGHRYFSEGDIVERIASKLDIVSVHKGYLGCWLRLEAVLLRAAALAGRLDELLNMGTVQLRSRYGRWARRMERVVVTALGRGRRRRLVGRLCRRAVGGCWRAAGWRGAADLVERASRRVRMPGAASHIVIVAANKRAV